MKHVALLFLAAAVLLYVLVRLTAGRRRQAVKRALLRSKQEAEAFDLRSTLYDPRRYRRPRTPRRRD